MKEIKLSLFRYLITLGLAAFLADKYFGGKLWLYINEKFFPLTIFAFVLLLLMALVEIYTIVTLIRRDKESALPDGMLRDRQALRQAQGRAQGAAQQSREIIFAVLFTILPVAAAAIFQSREITLIAYLLACNYGFITVLIRTNGQDKSSFSQKNILSLIVLALPLMIGILSPERSLSASSLSNRGVSLNTSIDTGQASSISFNVQTDDRTILDWIRLFTDAQDQTAYIGQNVDVIGLVYHDPRLQSDQFMISRFVITCCAADAFAIGMTVNWPESAELAENSWVRVEGSLDVIQIDKENVPLIQANRVELITAPEQPYLYP